MELIKSKYADVNYLAKIVNIEHFVKHSNPEVTRMKCAVVDGFRIAVDIDSQPGYYVYFPTNCQINGEFLRYACLYRHSELNADPTKSGFFGDNGRVSAIKLKGEVSDGFIIPFDVFNSFLKNTFGKELNAKDITNLEFNKVKIKDDYYWINKKYVVPSTRKSRCAQETGGKKIKSGNRIIETQFHKHYDTTLLRKTPWVITPDSLISITSKIHGTSGISAYLLCEQPLTFFDKIRRFISGFGWTKSIQGYEYIYSSRNIVFSKDQVYTEADKIVRPHLTKGLSVYYEIVGFLPNGKYIQNGYDYCCDPPKEGEVYTHEKHFKVRVYRITLTNVDGVVHEFSAREVQQWCNSVGLTPVYELYYGYAKDLYNIRTKRSFATRFMEKLANDDKFFMEKDSFECNNKVPQEGLVIKIEDSFSRAFKLKTFSFLNREQKELDAGVANIEDNA